MADAILFINILRILFLLAVISASSGRFMMKNFAYTWGISSNGRALALHARGTGIDTRILQYLIRFELYILGNSALG